MTGDLVPGASALPVATEAIGPNDDVLSEEAAARVARALSKETRRAYTRHWPEFERWCHLRGRTALPATAATLAEYTHYLTTTTTQYGGPPKPGTIDTILGCLQSAHKVAGHLADVRLARMALRDYRREQRDAGVRLRQSRPVTVPIMRQLVLATLDAVDAGQIAPLRGLQVQVSLVLGLAMAGRCSDVAVLDIADAAIDDHGLTVTISASKTDQDAHGQDVHIPYGQHLETCPVRLTQAWIDTMTAHDITSGPLLRGVDRYGHLAGTPRYAGRSAPGGGPARLSDTALNTLLRTALDRVNAAAVAAGDEPPYDRSAFSWHGLRAGMVTSAGENKTAPSTIATHARMRSLQTVMRYWRAGNAWDDNALTGIGL